MKKSQVPPFANQKQGDLSHKQRAFDAEKDKHKKNKIVCVCIEAGKQRVNSEKVTEKLLKTNRFKNYENDKQKKYKKSKKTKL